MGNLFCSEYSIHRRFDLKGSSLGRTTDKPESEINSNTILKDLDLNFIFRLQKAWFQEFIRLVTINQYLYFTVTLKNVLSATEWISYRITFIIIMTVALIFRQVDKDCEFLEQERIMDYSLLVGIHFREASVAGELIPSGARTPIGSHS